MTAACADLIESIDSMDDLVDALATHERRGAQIACAAAQFNAAGSWALDGSLSMAAWLRSHARLSHRDASRLLREGKFLFAFDDVADAATSGRLSASQIAALRAVVDTHSADLFADHQGGVIDAITDLNPADTERVCQQWKANADAIIDRPAPKVPDQSWNSSTLDDGTTIGNFVFGPSAAEQLETALETARQWDGADDQRSTPTRNSDAMLAVIAFFNANNDTNATRRHRPHVELNIQTGTNPALDPALDPADTVCALTANGRLLPGWATDAFLCDCVMHRVMRSGAAVLDYGRGVRTVPAPLWKAVAARDCGCRVPGCGRKKAWCDAHHIRWWRKHGETKLDNLILLCSRHHHLIHRDLWKIELDATTGIATFTLPNGTTLTSHPPGTPTIRAG